MVTAPDDVTSIFEFAATAAEAAEVENSIDTPSIRPFIVESFSGVDKVVKMSTFPDLYVLPYKYEPTDTTSDTHAGKSIGFVELFPAEAYT